LKKLARESIKFVASGFFTGYVPRGGGSIASLLACAAWILLPGETLHYGIASLLVTALGFSISGYAEREVFFERDSPRIVIDEIAGMLLTYVGFTFSPDVQGLVYAAAGFLFFRAFDILKPGPVGLMQNLRAAPGIMLDDVAAAAFANGLLWLIRILVFH
jgi:phosphatidylglycerophosphatase A